MTTFTNRKRELAKAIAINDAPIVAALSDFAAITKRAWPLRETRPRRRNMPCPGEK